MPSRLISLVLLELLLIITNHMATWHLEIHGLDKSAKLMTTSLALFNTTHLHL